MGGSDVRAVQRPGSSGRGPGPGRGSAPRSQLHRHRAHPPRPVHEREGVAARALESLGVKLHRVRQQVEQIIGQGDSSPSGHIPFTPRAKKVLELSLREAMQLGHNYIGTEHVLLGVLAEGEGVACQVLVKLGANLPKVRGRVRAVIEEARGEAAAAGNPRLRRFTCSWQRFSIPTAPPGGCSTWSASTRWSYGARSSPSPTSPAMNPTASLATNRGEEASSSSRSAQRATPVK
jgi:Clp amino terminal domain, pathogenicity island component